MVKSETLHVQIDSDIKHDVEELLRAMGMTTSQAVGIFFHQIINYGGIPFSLSLPQPNSETRKALEEGRDIASGRIKTKGYHSFKEMLDDIMNEDDDDDEDYDDN